MGSIFNNYINIIPSPKYSDTIVKDLLTLKKIMYYFENNDILINPKCP